MENLQDAIETIKFYHNKYSSPPADLFYGVGDSLKRYLNIPKFIPLCIEMDHGVYLSNQPIQWQLKTNLPIFVTRESQKLELLKYSKSSFIMGSPFVHYRRLNQIKKSGDAKGTVSFPMHSSHLVDVIFDWENYANQLLELPACFHPITVCLYWKDLLENRHKHFTDKDFRIVTAGHMCDPEFIENFYKILTSHKYSTSNDIGSNTFYSIDIDIPFFLYGEPPLFNNHGGDQNSPSGISSSTEIPDIFQLYKYFRFNLNDVKITPEIKDTCNEKLGVNSNINKNTLRIIILIASVKHFAIYSRYLVITKIKSLLNMI